MKKEEKNMFDILMDDENEENVILYDKDNNKVEFAQVALISLDDKGYYAILKPISKINGVEEDEALVFKLVEEDDYNDIVLCQDIDIINQVFLRWNTSIRDTTRNNIKVIFLRFVFPFKIFCNNGVIK